MNRFFFAAVLRTIIFAFALFPHDSHAATVSLDTDQFGGVFADGELNNKIGDQLYYVGYTIPTGGSVRAPERRNFFVFDFSKVAPGMGTITGADISLSLTVPGSIFYGDDDGAGPGPKDTTEEYILSFDPLVDPALLLSLDTDDGTNPGGAAGADADKMTAGSLFPAFGDELGAVTDPYLFSDSEPSGTPGTGTFNPATEAGEVVMAFSPVGLAILNLAYGAGETIVLTGKMPTWSESTAVGPGDPPDFLELDEGIFYHTLKDTDPVPTPFLDLTFTVPEPSSAMLLAAATSLIALQRRRK